MRVPHRLVLLGACSCILTAGCATFSTEKNAATNRKNSEAKIESTRASLASYATAMAMFSLDCGRFPTTSEGLEALIVPPGIKGWNGPYLKGGNSKDEWGTPLQYTSDPGKGFRICSAGQDRHFGSGDDIEHVSAENK